MTIVFLLLGFAAFFAVATAYGNWCDRQIAPDELPESSDPKHAGVKMTSRSHR